MECIGLSQTFLSGHNFKKKENRLYQVTFLKKGKINLHSPRCPATPDGKQDKTRRTNNAQQKAQNKYHIGLRTQERLLIYYSRIITWSWPGTKGKCLNSLKSHYHSGNRARKYVTPNPDYGKTGSQ